jgi:hypothetical protein
MINDQPVWLLTTECSNRLLSILSPVGAQPMTVCGLVLRLPSSDCLQRKQTHIEPGPSDQRAEIPSVFSTHKPAITPAIPQLSSESETPHHVPGANFVRGIRAKNNHHVKSPQIHGRQFKPNRKLLFLKQPKRILAKFSEAT